MESCLSMELFETSRLRAIRLLFWLSWVAASPRQTPTAICCSIALLVPGINSFIVPSAVLYLYLQLKFSRRFHIANYHCGSSHRLFQV